MCIVSLLRFFYDIIYSQTGSWWFAQVSHAMSRWFVKDLELPMEAYYSVQEQTSDEVPGESFGDAMMA